MAGFRNNNVKRIEDFTPRPWQYRLIGLDLDGTLLHSDKSVSDYTYKVLKKARKEGFKIVFLTGRPPNGLMRYAMAMDLFDEGSYAVCFNGAAIISLHDLKGHVHAYTFPTLKTSTMPGNEVAKIAAFAHQHGLLGHAYSVERGLTVDNKRSWSANAIINCRMRFKEMNLEKVEDKHHFYKIMMAGSPEKLDKFRTALPKEWIGKYSIARSEHEAIEFMAGNCDKGTGLLELCGLLGIKPAQTVVIGDAENDVPSLKVAGLAVAMANADAKAKAVADTITLTNDDDGVAYLVEKLLTR